MTKATFDTLIRGGITVLGDTVKQADIGIKDGRIVAIGDDLPPAGQEPAAQMIDARGLMVLPGGVDSHCHIEQISGAGLMNADTFESATRSAALGGTTTTISFAAQHPGHNTDLR
jgi:dihydropyrimidinase